MATTTNNFSLPYPQGNDPYNIPEDIANLAKSIDSSLKAVSDSVATIDYYTTETVEEVKKNLEILEQEINRAGLPNIEQIMVDIEEARKELEAAKEDFSVGQAELGVHLTNLRDERMPALEESVQEARNEMDTAMDEFMTRQTQFEDSISTAETEIANAKTRLGQNEDEIATTKDRLDTAENVLEDKADTSHLNELDGKLVELGTYFTKIWRQDTPPPAGTTYEWTDGAGMSASVEKIDGVEVRRNLAANPSYEHGLEEVFRGSGFPSATRAANRKVHGDYCASIKLEGASNTSATFYQVIGDVQADKYIAMKLYVQSGATQNRFRLRIPINYGSGNYWHSSSYYDMPYSFTEDGFTFVTQALDDGARALAYLQVHSPDGEDAPADAWVGTDAWHIAIADTEEAALAQVANYFDGDTPDDRQNDLWYDSDGVPHFWLKGWGWAVLEDQRLDNLSQILDDAQDDLETALEGPIDHERLRVGTGAFDEAFASKLIADHATIINAAMRNLSVSEKLLFAEAIGEQVWAKLGVFDKLEAEEGWVGGTMLEDGVVVTKVLEATEQIITNMFATNYAQIEEELVVKGKLFAENATLINAAMQNLDVAERANFVEAFAKELFAERFTAEVARLGRAIVASRNLWPDPIAEADYSDDSRITPLSDGRIRITSSGSGYLNGSYWLEQPIRAYPGDEFSFEVNFTRYSGADGSTNLYLRAYDADMNYISGQSFSGGSINGSGTFSTTQKFSHPDTAYVVIGILFTDKPEGQSINVNSIRIENMLDGQLIATNSVKTPQLDVDQIFGDTAVLNKLYSDLITARVLNAQEAIIGGALIKDEEITVGKLTALDEILTEMLKVRKIDAGDIAADAITAGKIAGGAIDGKTITGATVRTSASGARTEMTGGGVQVFNSANQVQVQMGHNVPTGLAIRQGSNMIPLAEHAFGSELYTGSNWSQGHGSSGSSMGSARTAGWSTNRAVVSNRYQIIMQLAGRPTRRSGANPNNSAQARVALVLRNRATDAIISSTTYALDTRASYFNSVGDIWETSKVWNTFYSVANITAPIGTIFYPQRMVWTIAGWNIAFTDLLVVLRPL